MPNQMKLLLPAVLSLLVAQAGSVAQEPQEISMCAAFGPFEDEMGEAMESAIKENPYNVVTPEAKAFYNRSKDSIESGSDNMELGVLLLPYKWKPGKIITVHFMDGTDRQRELTEKYAHKWEEYANITFSFVATSDSDIRVSFKATGRSWSKLGTSALLVPKSEPTMNYGWFTTSTEEEEYARTVLHEFGHALGLGHEHLNPVGRIKWKESSVIEYYKAMGWSEETIRYNVLTKLSVSNTNYTDFDEASIMLYPIDSRLTEDGYSVGWNTKLSDTDKSFIAKAYPQSEVASAVMYTLPGYEATAGVLESFKASSAIDESTVATYRSGKSQYIRDESLRANVSSLDIEVGVLQGARVPELHKSEVMLQIEPGISGIELRSRLESLQEKYGCTIKDTIPELGIVLVEIGPEVLERNKPERVRDGQGKRNKELGEASAIRQVISELALEPGVKAAAPNSLIGQEKVPSRRVSLDGEVGEVLQYVKIGGSSWSWGPRGARDGAWGLKATGFPAAWNVMARKIDEIRDGRSGFKVAVGVVDTYFARHKDIDFEESRIEMEAATRSRHGVAVAGIIGASWYPPYGVDGCSPFTRLVTCTTYSPEVAGLKSDQIAVAIFGLIKDCSNFLLEYPELRVLNLSLGYNWGYRGINPELSERVQQDIAFQGMMARGLAYLAERNGTVIVAAAGNDSNYFSQPVHAKWGSPFNWAALESSQDYGKVPRNMLVVESIDKNGNRSDFSNTGGMVSAPGEGIIGLSAGAGKVECNDCFDMYDGTSFAAPFVAGLAGLLCAYNPLLSAERVVDIIRDTSTQQKAEGNGAPIINAFDALLTSKEEAWLDLGDIDGDGKVTEQDQSIFWNHLQVSNRNPEASSFVNSFPRCDLNGDGKLDGHTRSLVGKMEMTDSEVFQHALQLQGVAANIAAATGVR